MDRLVHTQASAHTNRLVHTQTGTHTRTGSCTHAQARAHTDRLMPTQTGTHTHVFVVLTHVGSSVVSASLETEEIPFIPGRAFGLDSTGSKRSNLTLAAEPTGPPEQHREVRLSLAWPPTPSSLHRLARGRPSHDPEDRTRPE